MNESRHTWISHDMYALCHKHSETEFVYILAFAIHGNKTCHTYECVTSHICMNPVAYELCHTRSKTEFVDMSAVANQKRGMSHMWISRVIYYSAACVTWFLHSITDLFVWHDSLIQTQRNGVCVYVSSRQSDTLLQVCHGIQLDPHLRAHFQIIGSHSLYGIFMDVCICQNLYVVVCLYRYINT